MKHFTAILVYFLLSECVFSQSMIMEKVTSNNIIYSLPYNSNEKTFVKNSVYEANGLRVEVDANQFATSSSFNNNLYWKRYNSGTTTSGSVPIPSTSFDFVIGDGGNKILFVFFRLGIEYRVYEFLSGQYTVADTGVVTPVVYNPPISVMQYAGVALDIDQNDNVVLLYKSFNAGLYDSDVIDFFAKAGDIDGNWQTYSNSYNAFLVTQGLNLPNKFDGSRGDIGITKYTQNNMVNFVFPAQLPNGSNYLYLAQLSFNDLYSNNAVGLTHTTIESSNSDFYIFPSIDAPGTSYEPSLKDNWVLTYDVVHGKNDIKVAKGKNGSFISSPYLSNLLNLNKQLGLPIIRYMNTGFGLAFCSNDTTRCKEGWDPFFVALTDSLSIRDSSLLRLNIDSNLAGDQISLYYSMPHTPSAKPHITFFNQTTKEMLTADIGEKVNCSSQLSVEKDLIEVVPGNLLRKEIYSLDGRLLMVLDKDAPLSYNSNRVVVILYYYDSGYVKAEKRVFIH